MICLFLFLWRCRFARVFCTIAVSYFLCVEYVVCDHGLGLWHHCENFLYFRLRPAVQVRTDGLAIERASTVYTRMMVAYFLEHCLQFIIYQMVQRGQLYFLDRVISLLMLPSGRKIHKFQSHMCNCLANTRPGDSDIPRTQYVQYQPVSHLILQSAVKLLQYTIQTIASWRNNSGQRLSTGSGRIFSSEMW